MFAWGQKRPQFPSKEEQVATLRAALPAVIEADGIPDAFDVGLRLVEKNEVLRLRITLPPGFPEVTPVMHIVTRRCTHPLLDGAQRVVASPELNSWSPSKNLGAVIKSIMDRFGQAPPVYVPESEVARYGGGGPDAAGRPQYPAQYPGGPQQQQQVHQQQQQYPPSQYPPQYAPQPSGGGTPGGSRPGGLGPGPGVPRRPALSLPPVPPSFPGLTGLSMEDLQSLLEDEQAQLAFLHANIAELQSCAALVAAQRSAALEASINLLSRAESVAALKASVQGLEREAAQEREGAVTAHRRAQGVLDRFRPDMLARELEVYADELDRTSLAQAESFAGSDPAELADRFGGGGGGGAQGSWVGGAHSSPGVATASAVQQGYGGGGFGGGALADRPVGEAGAGGGSTVGGTGGASVQAAAGSPPPFSGGPSSVYGGSTVAMGMGGPTPALLALRDFREDFVQLRRRHHAAKIQAGILRSAGMAT